MKGKFVLNEAGVRELMKGEDMQRVLESYGKEVLARTGEGYKKNAMVGRNRANVMVYADSVRAKRDNLKNNTLTKAIK